MTDRGAARGYRDRSRVGLLVATAVVPGPSRGPSRPLAGRPGHHHGPVVRAALPPHGRDPGQRAGGGRGAGRRRGRSPVADAARRSQRRLTLAPTWRRSRWAWPSRRHSPPGPARRCSVAPCGRSAGDWQSPAWAGRCSSERGRASRAAARPRAEARVPVGTRRRPVGLAVGYLLEHRRRRALDEADVASPRGRGGQSGRSASRPASAAGWRRGVRRAGARRRVRPTAWRRWRPAGRRSGSCRSTRPAWAASRPRVPALRPRHAQDRAGPPPTSRCSSRTKRPLDRSDGQRWRRQPGARGASSAGRAAGMP
jgi:hypothetical protein